MPIFIITNADAILSRKNAPVSTSLPVMQAFSMINEPLHKFIVPGQNNDKAVFTNFINVLDNISAMIEAGKDSPKIHEQIRLFTYLIRESRDERLVCVANASVKAMARTCEVLLDGGDKEKRTTPIDENILSKLSPLVVHLMNSAIEEQIDVLIQSGNTTTGQKTELERQFNLYHAADEILNDTNGNLLDVRRPLQTYRSISTDKHL